MSSLIHHAIGFLHKAWHLSAVPGLDQSDSYDMAALRQSREDARTFGLSKMKNPEDFPGLGAGHIPVYHIQSGCYVPQLKTPTIVGTLAADKATLFMSDIHRAIRDLPVGVRQLFAEKGTEFVVGRYLSDIYPRASDREVGGSGGLSYEYVAACYDYDENHLAIAQEYRSQQDHQYKRSSQAYHFFLHEAGHGVDAMVKVTGNQFMTGARDPQSLYGKAFSNAYSADVRNLAGAVESDGKNLHYYLAATDGGTQESIIDARSELFAELFAEYVDGGTGLLHRAFPQSAEILKRVLVSLDYEFRRHPDVGHIPVGEVHLSPVSEKRIQPSCQT